MVQPKRYLKWLCLSLISVLILSCALLFSLPYSLPVILKPYGIHLSFEQPSWHAQGFSGQRFELVYQQNHISIVDLNLQWSWIPLQLQSVSANSVTGQWNSASDQQTNSADDSTDPSPYFHYLPQRLSIQQLDLHSNLLGHLSGGLHIDIGNQRSVFQPNTLEAELSLIPASTLWPNAFPQAFHPERATLALTRIEQQNIFTLRTEGKLEAILHGLITLDSTPHWSVSIQQLQANVSATDISWNDAHSQYAELALEDAELSLEFGNPFQLKLSTPLHLQLKQLRQPQLITQDWTVSGHVNGSLDQLNSELNIQGSHGLANTLTAAWNGNRLDAKMRLGPIKLHAKNALNSTFSAWPNKLKTQQGELESQLNLYYQHPHLTGEFLGRFTHVSGSFDAHQFKDLNLTVNADWRLKHGDELTQHHTELSNTGLSFALAHYAYEDMQVEQLSGGFTLEGKVDNQQLDIHLIQPATLASKSSVFNSDWRSQQLSLSLDKLHIKGDYADLALDSTLSGSLQRLQSSFLLPQNWSVAAQVSGPLKQLISKASLSNQHGLHMDSITTGTLDSFTSKNTIRSIDFSKGNPLAKTLKKWPSLLDLNQGQLSAEFTVNSINDSPLAVKLSAAASALNGIYNSSELSQVNIQLLSNLNNNRLSIELPRFDIKEINPGVPLSNISVRGAAFQAHIDALKAGSIQWQSAFAQLLGGTVYAGETQLKLDQDNHALVDVQGLQLHNAMQLYPTEGLAGTGLIDGTIPLQISLNGISVEKGQLMAREPGNLQFRSDALTNLARSNPAMQLLSQAMSDFNYTLLSSELDFEKDGKLKLNIRLHGSNPEVEKGRPIHLNFNLEENLYALLTSIQLNNHVSETIIERIRQRLQKDAHQGK